MVWNSNKAIDTGKWSIFLDGRLERFYCILLKYINRSRLHGGFVVVRLSRRQTLSLAHQSPWQPTTQTRRSDRKPRNEQHGLLYRDPGGGRGFFLQHASWRRGCAHGCALAHTASSPRTYTRTYCFSHTPYSGSSNRVY